MSYLSLQALAALNGAGVSSPLGILAPEVLLGDLINELHPRLQVPVADPGDGGAIPGDRSAVVTLVTGADAETRTVDAPEVAGMRLSLYFGTDGGGNAVVTFAGAFNPAGNTIVTHDTAGEIVDFVSVLLPDNTFQWRLVSNPSSVPVS